MPRAAPKPCSYPGCSAVVDSGTRCEQHAVTHTWGDDRRRGNRHQRGYDSKWVKKRDRILRRDNYLCRECLRRERVASAREVDHIIPKAMGGDDSDDNLQSLCTPCHKEKTAREANTARREGRGGVNL